MYCIAKRVVLPPLSEQDRKALLEQVSLLSVYEMLDAVPDPRGKHGLRYELSFLLTCLLAALLCNCNSTEAVAQWCQEQVQVSWQGTLRTDAHGSGTPPVCSWVMVASAASFRMPAQ